MRNLLQAPFAAVFANEVRLNAKRITPYVLMVLFSANAVLWWGWGPAVERGWATNSDFYILRNLTGFSIILGLPVFNAIIMGEPVIRDFRIGIDALLFSKPLGRASYLLGKFCGSFFVLVCCMSAFALTLLVLQWVPFPGMVVRPARVTPFIKHFFFVVVISHLVLGTFYFAAGTLTRNAKVVYGLAACFYPAYIAFQFLVKGLSTWWRVLMDPFGSGLREAPDPWTSSADFLNQYIVRYSQNDHVNRSVMVLVSMILLLVVYLRFSITERRREEEEDPFIPSIVPSLEPALNTPANALLLTDVTVGPTTILDAELRLSSRPLLEDDSVTRMAALIPVVTRSTGVTSILAKLIACIGVELRLIRTERSLIVLLPLAAVLSTLELAFYPVAPEVSYSVTYAVNTSKTLLFFILGMSVFYTGESMHRDREVRMEPILWSTPVSNGVLLLSKFLANLTLTLALVAATGLTAITIQFLRGHSPIEASPFLRTYFLIVVPAAVFLTAVAVCLNVILRGKHVTYAVSVGVAGVLFYLYSAGFNGWLYNPLLYQLWNYSDLVGGSSLTRILLHRAYFSAIASACLSLAVFLFARSATKRLVVDGRLSGSGWSIVMIVASLAMSLMWAVLIANR